MADPLAKFDFSLEFSENFATRLLNAVFDFHGVASRFRHDDAGQPGLLTTRQTVGGRFAYQGFLIDIEAGYDFLLEKPAVRFIGGSTQLIEINFGFGLKLPRNLVTRVYDTASVDTPLANDPTDVKQTVTYPEAHRTAPATDPYPGNAAPLHKGHIIIRFPIAQKPFSTGRRVSAATAHTSMKTVVSVKLDVPIDPRLATFIEITASKALTYLIAREIDDYDLTPLVGDLEAFGLKMREPVISRIGATASQRVLAFAANEYATIGDGDPLKLPYLSGASDFSASFREAMFAQLIFALYQDGVLPRRFAMNGLPDPGGPVLMEQPRISFGNDGLQITVRLDLPNDGVAIAVNATLAFEPQAAGHLHVKIKSLKVDIQFPGLGVGWLVNTITFHLLSAFVGDILASVLMKPINNSLDNGLQSFINSGALAFGFRSPIRGTAKKAEIIPTAFLFEPGTCTLRGDVTIV